MNYNFLSLSPSLLLSLSLQFLAEKQGERLVGHFLFFLANKDFRLEGFNHLNLNFLKGSCVSLLHMGPPQSEVKKVKEESKRVVYFYYAN